jgi:hypothetical protein
MDSRAKRSLGLEEDESVVVSEPNVVVGVG